MSVFVFSVNKRGGDFKWGSDVVRRRGVRGCELGESAFGQLVWPFFQTGVDYLPCGLACGLLCGLPCGFMGGSDTHTHTHTHIYPLSAMMLFLSSSELHTEVSARASQVVFVDFEFL